MATGLYSFLYLVAVCIVGIHTKLNGCEDTGEEDWIQQKLNHFDLQDKRTWRQRYIKNDAFYTPGGPVIVQLGGETALSDFRLNSSELIIEIAKEIHAMLFLLEHRFYGSSRPVGDLRVENLRFLTTEQALKDLVVFRENINAKNKGIFSKWILYGSSYPGSLAVWARLKFPHLFDAVVALSPPLEAKFYYNDYMKSVNRSLNLYGGHECYNSISEATNEISNLMSSGGGRERLKQVFNLCSLDSKEESMWVFHNFINNKIENIVQYSQSNSIVVNQPKKAQMNIIDLCKLMTDYTLGGAVQRFARLLEVRSEKKENCVNTNFDNLLMALSNTSWDGKNAEIRTWLYQICTEYGWFQTVAEPPFLLVPEAFPLILCVELFGPHVRPHDMLSGPKWTNSKYGGKNVRHSFSKTVIFNGGVDPWHEVSCSESNVMLSPDTLQKFPAPNTSWSAWGKIYTEPYGFNSIFIESCSHAEVGRGKSPRDSIELQNARNAILALVKLWTKDIS